MPRVSIAGTVMGAKYDVYVDTNGENAGGIAVEHSVSLEIPGGNEEMQVMNIYVPDSAPFMGLMGHTVSLIIDYDG